MIDKRTERTLYQMLVATLVIIHVALLAWNARVHFPLVDEIAHLPAGVSHWRFGNFRPFNVNPPLVRMVAAAPLLPTAIDFNWSDFDASVKARSSFTIGRTFLHDGGFSAVRYFVWARWACIPFSVAGAIACHELSKQLYGETSAIMALAIWCFSPSMLGYGTLIMPDLGAAACGVVAWAVFQKWLCAPSIALTVLLGASIGVALLTKSTWICLYLACALAYFAFRAKDSTVCTLPLRLAIVHVLIALFVGLYVVNLAYAFEGTFTRLGDFQFVSASLNGNANSVESSNAIGNRFADAWLGNIPVPLPKNFVQGIDYIKWEFERGYSSYLRGEWRHGGWWYYYLYAMLVKMPVGTLLLIGLAGVDLVRRLWREPRTCWNDLFILMPAMAILVLVSSQTGFNHHLRYVLPAFPFIFVWISQLAKYIRPGGRWPKYLVAGALTWSVTSSLWIYPHSLSYFNELAGGPKNGHRHLHNSNVDWGQDILYLADWIGEHPEIEELGVSPYTLVDLRKMGLPTYEANRWPQGRHIRTTNETRPEGPLPGWFAISQTRLAGEPGESYFGRPSEDYLDDPSRRYFRHFKPITTIGYSMFVYHVTLDEANKLRLELGLAPIEEYGESRLNGGE